MDLKVVLYEARDGVAIVTLNRPEALNALNTDVYHDLEIALRTAVEDASVRVMVLTGAGRAFCAGGDIKSMAARIAAPPPDRADPVEMLNDLHQLLAYLYEMDQPVIAAVHGPAVGAGMSLALACDFRVAAEDSTFSQGFIKIGLSPDAGSTWFLPRLIGAARALQMAMTGESIDARKALEWGLISQMVPAGQDLPKALELAHRLAALSPHALTNVKHLLRESETHSFREQLDAEAVAQRANAATPEFRAAVAAFVAKK
jgi:2-(1,2-epoxy-1,2-dihydrophenyl)acetyl-CoA isomerase